MKSTRILIAGVGNVFRGDEGFGCEVVRHIKQSALPPHVHAVDLGFRSDDLTFALAAGYDEIILVDTVSRGTAPGTVFLNQFDPADERANDTPLLDGRTFEVATVISGPMGRLHLVSCETSVSEAAEERVGLSPAVAKAVPRAVSIVRRLVRDLLHGKANVNPVHSAITVRPAQHRSLRNSRYAGQRPGGDHQATRR